MSLATSIAGAVSGALQAVGTDVILTRRITGKYDRPTHAAKDALIDYRLKGAWETIAARDVDGTAIQAGDRRLTISAQGVPWFPTTEDQVCDVFGAKYRILRVDRIEVADGAAAYTLMVRGNP